MFSFIHAADIHIDSPLRGLSQHEGAPVDVIRGATRRALENLVDLAIDEKVAFVIIAGDLYDGDWPDYSTGLFFNKQMQRLKQSDIKVYLITGNHDAESKTTKSLTHKSNVSVFSTNNPESIQHRDLSVTLHGQGFATQSVTENLAVDYPPATANHFNIGILHTSLAGSSDHDTYAPCSVADLNAKQYDYWALGHIHQREVIQKRPHIVYSGNPQGRHVKELGRRGCYLIHVDEANTIQSFEFQPLDVVRWEAPAIDISDCASTEKLREVLSDTMNATLGRADGRLLALRITLTGDAPLHDELISNQSQWQAECTNIAHEIDDEKIWFEQLKIKTTPTYDPKELAKRDPLTKLVLDALESFDPSVAPPDVDNLTKKLSNLNSDELSQTLTPTSPEHQEQLKKDISAIVINRTSIASGW